MTADYSKAKEGDQPPFSPLSKIPNFFSKRTHGRANSPRASSLKGHPTRFQKKSKDRCPSIFLSVIRV